METTTKVNSLKTVINCLDKKGNQYNIVIKLADECKNGHNDFSITGSIWEKGKAKTDSNIISCGAIGDTIAAKFPELAIFNRLHLCDVNGAPMYAISNGFYHLQNSSAKVVSEYLRTTPDETARLYDAESDEEYFTYLINLIELPKRWKAEADEAIKLLEQYNDAIGSFEDNSKNIRFYAADKEFMDKIKAKVDAGYYSDANILIRKNEAIQRAKNAEIEELTDNLKKDITKATNEYNIKIAVLNAGMSLDNFIYYNHTNEGCFNWHTNSFNKEVTIEEFNEFLKVVDMTNLPTGLVFKLK